MAGEVIAAETDVSTGTESRLMRRAVKRVEELHGVEVVPLPGKTAFYALVGRLAVGKHTFGHPAPRGQHGQQHRSFLWAVHACARSGQR